MKVAIVGPSKKFISGISYYTMHTANALSKKFDVDAILLRNLVPKFLFPASERVGKQITDTDFDKKVKVYNGIDWYWFPSIFAAIRRISKADYILLQWWTSATAHTYLLIKLLNKLFFKKKLIIELHELLDPYENNILPLRLYVRAVLPILLKDNYANIVHSVHDKKLISGKFGLNNVYMVSHPTYDNFFKKISVKKDKTKCNVLFFGLLRPYKGIEYLIDAFKKLDKAKFSLAIAGKAWKNYDITSKLTEDITYINKYLTDEEVIREFNKADVLVLPYLRSTQSGVAHIAALYGLPILATPVGGIKESMQQYKGTIFIKPKNSDSIANALKKIYPKRHKRYANPFLLGKNLDQYGAILK